MNNLEMKLGKQFILTIESKRIKKLEINSTKESQDIHTENYKTQLEELKENLNSKTFHVHTLKDLIFC